jgi:tRNA(fMet)-specific endonuclease VapC
MLVLDTSALSQLIRGSPLALAQAQRWRPGDLRLVPPVDAEIQYGLARLPLESRRRTLLSDEYERWRSVLRWLDWPEQAGKVYGREKARLEASGQRLDDMDLLIATIALCSGLGVATFNVRHFARVEDLAVEDWSRPRAR